MFLSRPALLLASLRRPIAVVRSGGRRRWTGNPSTFTTIARSSRRPISRWNLLWNRRLLTRPHFTRLSHHHPLSTPRSSVRHFSAPTPNATPNSLPLSAQLRHLIKSYGRYAIVIYGVVSVLDFGVALAGVTILGADRVSAFTSSAQQFAQRLFMGEQQTEGNVEEGMEMKEEKDQQAKVGTNHGGLFANVAVAFAIHKIFFFPVRVGVTVAYTPRIVNWLRAKGWAPQVVAAAADAGRRATMEMKARILRRVVR